jgi:hypothetical protein
MMKRSFWTSGFTVVTAIAAVPVTSLAAPQQLLEKYVQVRSSVTLEGRSIDGGPQVTGTQSQERIIYISNKGRIFARGNFSGASGSAIREQSPDKLSADDSIYRWQGNVLIGTSPLGQTTISFDAQFRTCSSSFVLRPNATSWDATHSKQWRVLNVTTNSVTCSIHDGNPFGDQ